MTAPVRHPSDLRPPMAARGPRRSVGERVTIGHVAPIVVGLVAALLVLLTLKDRSATTQVLVASREIPAGSAVTAANTHMVVMHSSDAALHTGLLGPSALNGSWVASSPIVAGDPITRSEVVNGSPGSEGLGAMSIPVPMSEADGGRLVVGDRVDVVAVDAGGVRYVAQDLRVVAVPSTSSGGALGATTSNSNYYVVVAVDRPTALKVAAAVAATGVQGTAPSVQIVRSTGETGTGG